MAIFVNHFCTSYIVVLHVVTMTQVLSYVGRLSYMSRCNYVVYFMFILDIIHMMKCTRVSLGEPENTAIVASEILGSIKCRTN